PAARGIEERAQAIQQAIAEAAAEDVVLLAGKGHETEQEIRGQRYPFDDAVHAKAALEAWTERQLAGAEV
ncbi:MAG: UDP-N-acetylmuramoyl-L-alanyl-D-glutamate--2,6-diaminopimelate ligase, partial [Fluviibacter sp.]